MLRPKAHATDQTETFRRYGVDGQPYLEFRYAVVRVWQEPLDRFLCGGLGLLPLALLTDDAAADLPTAFDHLRNRLQQPDVPATVVEELLI